MTKLNVNDIPDIWRSDAAKAVPWMELVCLPEEIAEYEQSLIGSIGTALTQQMIRDCSERYFGAGPPGAP